MTLSSAMKRLLMRLRWLAETLTVSLTVLMRRCRHRRRFLFITLLLLCSPLAVLSLLQHTGVTVRRSYLLQWSIGGVPSFWPREPPSTPSPTTQPSEAELLTLIRNGSVRCGDIQALFPDRIPPVIHWTNMDDRVLRQHQDLMRSWSRVLGDSVAYMYWNDKDAELLIKRHYQQVWQQYQRLRVGIMRSDIARLVILHHIGGVYTDLDVQLLRSLHPLMLSYAALWSQEPIEHVYYLYKRNRLLSNAVFMTKARHQFLQFVLNSWPTWFETQWSRKQTQLRDANQAIHITGPVMLNHFLDIYPNTTKDPVFLAQPEEFQPIWDGWYVQRILKNQCTGQRNSMPPEHRRHCDLLRARNYEARQPNNETYAVHKFMHTSYGTRNYAQSKPARDILQLSHCVI